MKKKKTIFILGIFLVLLIGVYGIIIMNNKKQKEEETTQTETQETKTLLNLNKEDIVKLSYIKENNIMEFDAGISDL